MTRKQNLHQVGGLDAGWRLLAEEEGKASGHCS
jgi:hypothetical protein